MNKKTKGFSLAELLISLLIISIVLSAALPTVMKKRGLDNESIWTYDTTNSKISANSENISLSTAGRLISDTNGNVAIGKDTLPSSGSDITSNTAVGNLALSVNANKNNTAIGANALLNNESGYDNTAIGISSCSGVTTGNYNICIGSYAGNAGDVGKLYIGGGTIGDNNVFPIINGEGMINNNSEKKLYINARQTILRNETGTNAIFTFDFTNENGTTPSLVVSDGTNTTTLTATGLSLSNGTDTATLTVTTLSGLLASEQTDTKIAYIPSDKRLKNIQGENTAGLKEISQLEVKNYTYKSDKQKTPHVGVIAQQLQKVFPNAVTKDEKGYLSIRQEDIFYAMVNSIKELLSKVQELTAKLTGVDKKITELEAENKLLKDRIDALEQHFADLEQKQTKYEKKQKKN